MMTATTLKHETRTVPTYSPTRHGQKIRAIVVHHEAGILSAAAIQNVFKNRKSSANYSIDKAGNICLHVYEENRAWTTGGTNPDDYAVTIELSNDKVGGNWHISNATIEAAERLCADICRRYGIKKLYYDGKNGTLLRHCDFQATACPGDYFKSITPAFCEAVNKLISCEPEPDSDALYHVQTGAFKSKENAEKQAEELRKQGIQTVIKKGGDA